MQKDYKIDMLKTILSDKKKSLNNNTDQKEIMKIFELEKLFNNDRCFFYISFETAINILQFLDIPNDLILDTYKQLTDPKLIKGDIKFK